MSPEADLAMWSSGGAGVFFEDLSVGQIMESGLSQITQRDINDFARLSRDRNPIHTNLAFAREHGYSNTIAHGALVFARSTGLAYELGMLVKASAKFKQVRLDFKQTVYPDDSIRIKMKIVALTPFPMLGEGKVDIKVQILNQNEAIVQRDSWTAVVTMRPQSKEADKP